MGVTAALAQLDPWGINYLDITIPVGLQYADLGNGYGELEFVRKFSPYQYVRDVDYHRLAPEVRRTGWATSGAVQRTPADRADA